MKELADTICMVQMGKIVSDRNKNPMEQGETADYQHLNFILQYFQNYFSQE